MHRFHSRSCIHRFKFAAFLLCLKYLLVALAVGILGYSIITDDRDLTLIAIVIGVLAMLVILLQCLIASRTRCPLCLTPVLAGNGCSKHHRARTLLGSHRLPVALAALFKGTFLCPYCHERSALEVRTKHQGNSPDSRG